MAILANAHAALPGEGEEVLIAGAGGSGGAARGSGKTAGKKLTAKQKMTLRSARKRRKEGNKLTKAHSAALARHGTPGEKRSVKAAARRAAKAGATQRLIAGGGVIGKAAKKVAPGKKSNIKKTVGKAAKNAKAATRRVAKTPRRG